jgi:hypothetical protein
VYELEKDRSRVGELEGDLAKARDRERQATTSAEAQTAALEQAKKKQDAMGAELVSIKNELAEERQRSVLFPCSGSLSGRRRVADPSSCVCCRSKSALQSKEILETAQAGLAAELETLQTSKASSEVGPVPVLYLTSWFSH